MSAGAAQLIDEQISEGISSGFVRYDMTRTYQVITTDKTDSSFVALGAAGLPSIGTTVLLGGSVPIYCLRRVPKRTELTATGKKWNITTTWSNDAGQSFLRTPGGLPTFNPVDTARQVQVEYQETSEPIRDAQFLSITDGPFHNGTTVAPAPTWLAGTVGPIINSAGDPILSERPNYNRIVKVWKWYRDYPDQLEDYINNINSAEVTITITDIDGPRGSLVFPAKTLRVGTPVVEERWMDGRLYFRAGMVLIEDKRTWIHSELDRGQRYRVFNGQIRSDGTNWTDAQLAALDPEVRAGQFGLLDIEQEGYAPGEPIRLNGNGAPCQYDATNKDKAFYVNFKVFDETDFSGIAHLS